MTMATLRVEITAPDKVEVFEDVAYVSLDASTGSLGVLPGHADILGELGIGMLLVRTSEGEKVFAVAGGFFEVRDGVLRVLADALERQDEIDVERALAARRRAEQMLESSGGGDPKARVALMRARNRLRIAGKG